MTTPTPPPPEPPVGLAEPDELLPAFLDHYRDTVLRKLDGLSDEELRTSRLPSGWTPLGLLKHLAYVERRWFRWGFAAEKVRAYADPEGRDGDADWVLEPHDTPASVREFFRHEVACSRRITAAARYTDRARLGEGFEADEEPPTLAWIMAHMLQEYARHAGHLDVARELADGVVGE
ncbi:DinB family protein [Streptantibioticus cattleyicolor]|uniref:Mini-circle protein n=1 Tax=Streptantibioticus cattleyicolor (strain ATCC 35852 / DSM 46488 / JCM 4925 / NBRC 14057 / NRRL 8057) TaxID=1003195 RepID=F8JMQ7_STREN|nr:DinB family protein [Streptantibioticus cattleyicolor]AEW99308.1 hypothetical protein SCATT_p11150 [Streptantibioticus cattleyicolor NRRL 8057 = DSM 46488]CCB71653.1 conserved protein of unknown function [Streptantibioticus cattleyicolor NRRL 8057 = DSM 46488]